MTRESEHVETLRRALAILTDDIKPGLDELAAIAGIYGLRLWADAGFHSQSPAFRTTESWDDLKKVVTGVGSALNNVFGDISLSTIRALRYHPDYRVYRDDNLTRAILAIDRLEVRTHSGSDSVAVGEVLTPFMGQRPRNQTVSAAPFTTPSFLNALCSNLLVQGSPQNPSIYDPACGIGGSLVALDRAIKDNVWTSGSVTIHGQDKDARAVFVAAWHLLLTGVSDFQLEVGDALAEPRFTDGDKLQRYDLIVSQPPVYYTTDEDFGSKDRFQRFRYGNVPGSRADYAFVQHVLATLSSIGQAAVIFPVSALSRSGFEEDIRAGIVHAGVLDASLSFRGGIMLAKNVPAAVLVFRMSKWSDRNKRVFFDDEGLQKSSSLTNPLTPDSKRIRSITERVLKWQEVLGASKIVSEDDLRANRYNLNPQAYVPRGRMSRQDVGKLDNDIIMAEDEMNQASSNFRRAMDNLSQKPSSRLKKFSGTNTDT